MRSSRTAVLWWFVIAVNVILGGVLLTVAVGAPESWSLGQRLIAGVVGLAFVGLAIGVQRVFLSNPSARRGVSRTELDGSPAVVVRLRPDTIVFGFATMCGLALVLAAGAVLMWSRSTGAVVVLAILALSFAVFAV